MKKTLLAFLLFFSTVVPFVFAETVPNIPRIPYTWGLTNTDYYGWTEGNSTTVADILVDGNGYPYWEMQADGNIELATTTVLASNYSLTLGSAGAGWNAWAVYSWDGTATNRFRLASAFSGDVGVQQSSFTVDGATVELMRFQGFSATTTANALGSNGVRISQSGAETGGRLYLLTYTTADLSYIDTEAELYAFIDALGVGGAVPGATNTRIVEQVAPANGATTASSFVTFEYDYFLNDVTDPDLSVAGVDINDVTSGFQYIPLTSAISASGLSTFLNGRALEEGHFHMWRPFLTNASSSRFIYGSWNSFDVVSPSGEFSPLDPSADMATSTALGRFFSQQGYLASKFPFAYFYDVADIVSTINDEVTEDDFPTLTLNMSSSSLPIGNLEFLSKDTVEMFAGSSMVSVFRTLMSAFLWLVFAFGVYAQIKRLIH